MIKAFIIIFVLLILIIFHENYKYKRSIEDRILKNNDLKEDKTTNYPISNDNYISNINLRKSNEDRINGTFVFIAGNHGSGTSLMRAILDVKLNCGYETRVIRPLLNLISELKQLPSFTLKTNDYLNVIDRGLSLFLIEIMKKNNETFDILCAKDPGDIDILYLKQLFPNIRIVYMVRDGRASAMSNIRRHKETLDLNKFYEYVNVWNDVNRKLYDRCEKMGNQSCKIVIYEQLVTRPKFILKDLINFIGLNFTKEFLRHDELSKNIEHSNSKVKKSINSNRLKTWQGKIDYDLNYMKSNFEMFEKFGFKLD